MRNQHAASLRPSWLDALVLESQRVAGRLAMIDPDDARTMLCDFVRSLPQPASQVERLVMRGMLLETAWRCGTALHRRWHRDGIGKCTFEPASVLERFWAVPARSPVDGFLRWIDALFAELARAHPASVAVGVSRLIEKDYQRSWSLADLARRAHVTPSHLRRAFAQEFGVSIREYQRDVRIREALEHIHGKIDAIALQVGYRGKKNFYRAFQQVTGLTLTAFRQLSDEQARHVKESVGATKQPRSTADDRRR